MSLNATSGYTHICTDNTVSNNSKLINKYENTQGFSFSANLLKYSTAEFCGSENYELTLNAVTRADTNGTWCASYPALSEAAMV